MSTKASLLEGRGRRVVHNLKRDSILREAQARLERLGVDAIDLYRSPEHVSLLVEAARLELSQEDITTIEGAQ